MALYFTIKKTFKVYLKWENYTNKKINNFKMMFYKIYVNYLYNKHMM